jgi:hypothetical protein
MDKLYLKKKSVDLENVSFNLVTFSFQIQTLQNKIKTGYIL